VSPLKNQNVKKRNILVLERKTTDFIKKSTKFEGKKPTDFISYWPLLCAGRVSSGKELRGGILFLDELPVSENIHALRKLLLVQAQKSIT
jgi:hypothetical protein